MQSRLFPDPQPLVERFGREFFRQLPETPGVYLMRDSAAEVLYVGKAKNLRKRVCSYRVANPERMPRRTLRLLRLVENIGWEECGDEPTALRRESELLLALKPRFNRAGVWRGPECFLAWRCTEKQFELAVAENPECGWEAFSALGGKAPWLHFALVRLLWFMAHPETGVAGMPVGWVDGRIGRVTAIPLRSGHAEVIRAITILQSGQAQAFRDCVRAQMTPALHPFLKSAVESDLEFIDELFNRTPFRSGG